MNAIKSIIEKASKLNGTVVLPEGMDARVITAACSCVDRKICTPIVLGTPQEIAEAEAKAAKERAAEAERAAQAEAARRRAEDPLADVGTLKQLLDLTDKAPRRAAD